MQFNKATILIALSRNLNEHDNLFYIGLINGEINRIGNHTLFNNNSIYKFKFSF